MWFLLYNLLAVPFQFIFYHIARFFNKKISDGMKGRKGQHKKIMDSLSGCAPGQKRILFHCVSVGEWEQAKPVIARLKENDPEVFIIVMFFSPSGYNYVKDYPYIDLKVYMPFDSGRQAKKCLEAIKPDLWIIVKHDVWPNHLRAAGQLNIPTVLIDANLPTDSKRLKACLNGINRAVYGNFDYIFPISPEDKGRFLQIYPHPEKMFVCGDTRYDQVYLRSLEAAESGKISLFDNSGSHLFIAGSIWPSDEKHLLPAVLTLLKKYPELNIVLVPHEPAETHINDIENVLTDANFETARFTEIESSGVRTSRVVIVDTVGILAKLYVLSDITFVGGSFDPGVHNVMEPGIFEQPILFGPKHLNSLEAIKLTENGGGFVVRNSEDIINRVSMFLDDDKKRENAGKIALRVIKENFGATGKICTKLEELYDFIPAKNTD